MGRFLDSIKYSIKKIITYSLLIGISGALAALTVQPVAAGDAYAALSSGGGWIAEYFDNRDLNGAPVGVFLESSPSHNWGFAAPFGGMPADNFSVRWTSAPVLEGTYRLSVRADDGARVWVGEQLLIDEWHLASGQTFTREFSVPRGPQVIRVEYFEAGELAFIEFSLIPLTVAPPSVPVSGGIWTAQYFANEDLAGHPAAVFNEGAVSHNWSSGAPFGGMPADHFSARWSTAQFLSSGTYRVSVRSDDGVRALINGALLINEWRTATGITHSADISLPAGVHTIVVEYFERTGLAFIEFSLTKLDGAAPEVVAGPHLRVAVNRLNVRAAPSAITGQVITQIQRDQIFPIIGRNADATWWQIRLPDGRTGWVFASLTVASNIRDIAITAGRVVDAPPATGLVINTLVNLNLRAGPGTVNRILLTIPKNAMAQLLGRNATTTWWKVNYQGRIGWVSAAFVTLRPGFDLRQIPILSA